MAYDMEEIAVPASRELTLEEIGRINLQRCEAWHKGDQPWSLERWITATLGELGEMGELILLSAITASFGRLANDAKKEFRALDGSVGIRKGETLESLQEEINKEWADTMLYMILLASYRGINMTETIRRVFNTKSEQLGFSERL